MATRSPVVRRSSVGLSPRLEAFRRPTSASAETQLTSRDVWLCALMLFFLTAANGRPYWWNSAVPSVFISVWLIGSRGPRTILERALSKHNRPIFLSLLGLTAWSGVAALAATDMVAGWTFVLRCVIPLLIYFALVGMQLKRSDVGLCLLAIVVGSSVPMLSGLYAFYREVGVPDIRELLYVRYDQDRMWNYMDVTFGNVGHMGMYAGLVAPCIVVASSARVFGRSLTALSRVWLGVVLLNIVIGGSRTSWALAVAVGALLLLSLQRGLTVVAMVVGIVGGSMYVVSLDIIDQGLLTERVLPSIGGTGRDVSVEERVDSIGIGWETFMAHPLVGVGPGLSASHNIYSVPHQSILMVASEIGIFGGLAFLILNVVVLFRCAKHALRARGSEIDRHRLVWIIGPATWLTSGLMAGVSFNMDIALLWVGIAHAMLGLYGLHYIQESVPPEGQPRVLQLRESRLIPGRAVTSRTVRFRPGSV
jgi:O-antigen ligase